MISEDNHIHNIKRKLQHWGFLFFVALLVFGFTRCSESDSSAKKATSFRYEIDGEAQGTTYHLVYFTVDTVVQKQSIDSILDNIDAAASMWVPTSIISRVNQSQDSVIAIEDYRFPYFEDNFNLSKEVYFATDGAYNPTVGALVNAWGFGFKNREKMDSTKVDSLLQSVGFENDDMWIELNPIVTFHKSNPKTQIDFNGIAQGYSVDVLAAYFQELGIYDYMLEVGGELIAHGAKPEGALWKIGVDKPVGENMERELFATITLENIAVATSGNYRKFYEENGVRYAHTIDPKTGFPVQHSLLSATVIMENCGLADAYATSFMVMGKEKAQNLMENHPELGIEAYLIYSDSAGALHTYFSPGVKKMITEL